MKTLVIVCGESGSGKELIIQGLVEKGFERTSVGNLPITESDLIVTDCVKPENNLIDFGEHGGYQVRIVTCEIVNQ